MRGGGRQSKKVQFDGLKKNSTRAKEGAALIVGGKSYFSRRVERGRWGAEMHSTWFK